MYVEHSVHADESRFGAYADALKRLGVGDAVLTYAYIPVGAESAEADAAIETIAARHPAVVIAASGKILEAIARNKARFPTVFVSYADPIISGIIESYHKPGGRITGISILDQVDVKRLEVLIDSAPGTRRIGVVSDEGLHNYGDDESLMAAYAASRGVDLQFYYPASRDEVVALISASSAQHIDGWYIPATYVSYIWREDIVKAVSRLHLPAMFTTMEELADGAAVAYVMDHGFVFDTLASLTRRIVDGADPGTIPIERPKRYLLAVRAGDARWPGGAALLRRADIVIGDYNPHHACPTPP